jgi:uroporphyrinogen decarboxylase
MAKKGTRGKELIFETFRHVNLDVPWVPFAGIHAGRFKGYTASEILQDKAKLMECLLEVKKA